MTLQPIILVNPGGNPETDALEKDRDSRVYIYPFSLLFLQNYLIGYNIQSRIFDLNQEKPEELLEVIKSAENPIIGITAQPHSVLKALELIQQLKKINKNSFIVVGGNFFTMTHLDVLARYKDIDVVVRDEGEITFYELVNALKTNRNLENIEGITYRVNGIIIENKTRKAESEIEKFTLKYDLLPVSDRFREGILMRNYEKENFRSFPVFIGRGCSRRCAFCEYNQFRYRVRKIPAILTEIDFLIKNYKAEYFAFADPSFCEREKFVKEFCEILIEKYPHIKWSCEARADTSLDTLELMARAGCISIDFGLESGSEKVLKAINKDNDLLRTNSFVRKCHSLGIRTHMFLMVSLPEETEEDAMQTIQVCGELSEYVTSISLGVTQILPGTELERIAIQKGILSGDFSYYDERFYHAYTQFCDPHIPIYLEHLSIGFIEKFFTKINDLRAQKYDSLHILIRKTRTGILTLHKRPLRKNIIYFRRFLTAVSAKIKAVFFN
jgi:radical SAM superfamily enzyme YgiQ (UPF0313 family)